MRARLLGAMTLALLVSANAWAYPEFQTWISKHSGHSVDCAMCHVNPEGPEGLGEGQIRGLDRQELERLNDARAAFQPGIRIDSPILNEFGNRIIERLGRKEFLEIRVTDPGRLVAKYGFESDLDGDGIPDAQEYLDGTLPIDPRSGDPWLLFAHNLGRRWLDLLMVILATLCGLFGLNQMLHWFEFASREEETADATVDERHPRPRRRPTRARTSISS
ncbi:MAG: hypothetical protein WBX15_20050 [Thermoanaerobaculia bacterium]